MNFIRARERWGARAPRSIVIQDPQKVHTLVVHHTVSKSPVTMWGAIREMRNLQRMHMDGNGWSDIGYNIVIDRRGRIWEGRGLRRVGAHTAMSNTGTIGVAFMGNYDLLQLNSAQLKAFNELQLIMKMHGFQKLEVRGHRQMPNQKTACPGTNIMRQLGLNALPSTR